MTTENMIVGDVGEGAPGPAQPFSQTESPSLWDVPLFGPTEDEQMWAKAVEGTKSILTHIFNGRWTYAYLFQDGETDHFFYKSYNKGHGDGVSFTPEDAWASIIAGYQLPEDRPMAKYQLVWNENAAAGTSIGPFGVHSTMERGEFHKPTNIKPSPFHEVLLRR